VNGWFWDSTLADREQAFEASTKAVNFLREITPDSGAYVVSVAFSRDCNNGLR
jgi:hypothetical protein